MVIQLNSKLEITSSYHVNNHIKYSVLLIAAFRLLSSNILYIRSSFIMLFGVVL